MKERKRGKEHLDLNNRIVIFIGPEGSGKSTIAKILAAESGLPYISTGDRLRYLKEHDKTALGDEIRAMFEGHGYLSGESLLKAMKGRYAEEDTEHGFVLDGALRTQEEIDQFSEVLKDVSRQLPIEVIYLDVPEDVSVVRLLKRGREDDTEVGIRTRLSTYNRGLGKRLESIGNWPNCTVHRVDASVDKDSVYKTTINALHKSMV